MKLEVERDQPSLRPAFSRPGLLTFKSDESNDVPRSSFARVSGTSLGSFAKLDEVAAAIAAHTSKNVVVHVFEREPTDAGPPAFLERMKDELAAACTEAGVQLGELRSGATVCDVIVAEGEPTFVGYRLHRESDWSVAGGLPRILIPPSAPSRAFAKIEEALCWIRPALRPSETVLEIGSAPGGVSAALVGRGLKVVGIDPGDMDEAFLARAGNRFTHVKSAMGAVTRDAFPPNVAWIVLDVNLAPQVAVHGLKRFVAAYRGRSLRGVFLTLKMNDDAAVAAIPTLLARVAGMGLTGVRSTQLPSNRSEICVFAASAPRK